MARSFETGMIVNRSRIFGGKEYTFVESQNMRHVPEKSRPREVVLQPWLEVDFGEYSDLERKYRHLGRHTCIAAARVNGDVIELAQVGVEQDRPLRIALNPSNLAYANRPSGKGINWHYEGRADFWVPGSDEEVAPSEFSLSRQTKFSNLHIMPIRHDDRGRTSDIPEITIYAR